MGPLVTVIHVPECYQLLWLQASEWTWATGTLCQRSQPGGYLGGGEGMSEGDPQELITGGTAESCPADGDGYRDVGRSVGFSKQKALGKSKDPNPMKTERCPVWDTGRSVVCVCAVCNHRRRSVHLHPLGLQASGPVYPNASNQRNRIWRPGMDMSISTIGPLSWQAKREKDETASAVCGSAAQGHLCYLWGCTYTVCLCLCVSTSSIFWACYCFHLKGWGCGSPFLGSRLSPAPAFCPGTSSALPHSSELYSRSSTYTWSKQGSQHSYSSTGRYQKEEARKSILWNRINIL